MYDMDVAYICREVKSGKSCSHYDTIDECNVLISIVTGINAKGYSL